MWSNPSWEKSLKGEEGAAVWYLFLFSPCTVLTSSMGCAAFIEKLSKKPVTQIPLIRWWSQYLPQSPSFTCNLILVAWRLNPWFPSLFIWSSQNTYLCSFFFSYLPPSSPAFPVPPSQASLPPRLFSLQSLFLTSVTPFQIALDSFTRRPRSLVCKRPYLVYLALLWSVSSMALPWAPCYLSDTLLPRVIISAVPHHAFWGSHIDWWENCLQRLPCQLPCQAGDVSCIVLTWDDQSPNQEEGTSTWKPEKIAVNLFPLEKYHSSYHSCSQWFYSQSRFPEGRGEKVKLKTPTQSFPFHVFLAKQKFQQQAPAGG